VAPAILSPAVSLRLRAEPYSIIEIPPRRAVRFRNRTSGITLMDDVRNNAASLCESVVYK